MRNTGASSLLNKNIAGAEFQRSHHEWTKICILAAVTVLVIITTPFFGVTTLGIHDIATDQSLRYIFFSIRIPRLIVSFCAGGGLALCGMVYQGLFRNPLASASTLGIASGASFGAAVSILLGAGGSLLGMTHTAGGAFIGSLGAMALILSFSQLRHGSSLAILLAGVMVGMTFSSLLMLLHYISSLRHSYHITRWLMGGVDGVTAQSLFVFIPLYCIGLILAVLRIPELDQFIIGEDLALTRGVNVKRSRLQLVVGTSMIIGAIMALCGPIGFIGIMAPHLCRSLFIIRHRLLAVTSFLTGGIFLTLCDTVGRTAAAPAEIPVGIITALCGGPFFVWILFSQLKKEYF